MDRYTVSGIVGAATAATVDLVWAQLWNPSTANPLFVKEIHYTKFTATGINVVRLARTSTIGTVGSTVTPTIVNEHDHALAPPSVATLGLGLYSVQPTVTGALRLHTWIVPASIGAGFMWVFEQPVTVKPGTGLALTNGTAVASDVGASVTYSWLE